MRVARLQIRNFRILEQVDISLAHGVNWFFGANGAGKTSILEALHVLAKGRSFRGGHSAALIGNHEPQLQVVAWPTRDHGEGIETLGVERRTDGWQGRIAGQDVQRVADFARRLPLVLFEPGSHALVEGGPGERRQYLDWTLFHVEHQYLDRWRRHARQIRQRNAALRSGGDADLLDTFEAALVESAGALHRSRLNLVERLNYLLEPIRRRLGIRLDELAVVYRPGWPQDQDLASALRAARRQDRERGHTRYGPHRADLVLMVGAAPATRRLSRGQQKLYSLALLLAQHTVLAEALGFEPLLLLDDPVSELDAAHLEKLWAWVSERSGQTWVTSLARPASFSETRAAMFHVEHGRVENA